MAKTVRTRSQSNVEKAIGIFSQRQEKKRNNKKRSSDVGTQPHQYGTRRSTKNQKSTRNVLEEITNKPVGPNSQGGGGKRIKHRIKKSNTPNNQTQQLHEHDLVQRDCRQVLPPAPSTNAGVNNLLTQKNQPRQDSEFDDIEISNEDVEVSMQIDSEDEGKKDEDEILAIDSADMHNPQACCEYIDDIMKYYKEAEGRRHPKPDYMDMQKDINSKMREILIDWLNEVHLKFKLRPETMYLTVNLIDRFLSLRAVSRTKLQLVGCTAMLIASKYEEIYAPEVRDFVYISDHAYTRDEILMMESIMLNKLQFNVTVPSALRFGQRFLKLVHGANERFRMLVQYLMELTLQNYDFIKHLPSMVAASATYLAIHMVFGRTGKPEWTSLLRSQTHYSINDLQGCVCDLHTLAAKMPVKYRAVRKKYESQKFLKVATIPVGPLSHIY